MDLIVENGFASWGAVRFRCAVGKDGLIAAADKRETDGKTPIGRWIMRQVIYRADRLPKPVTALPVRVMQPNDGWSERPEDPAYNTLIHHPHAFKAEHMWREDHVYDVVVVLGHNDRPVVPNLGSAIFFHVASPDFGGTAGCVTLALDDVLTVLRDADEKSYVDIRPAK